MPHTPQGTAYDLSGPEGAPVLVLIHGLGLNRCVTWDAMMPALTQTYRVLRYDLLGHGDTPAPDANVSLTTLSHQVIDLMDTLGVEQATLVGFSLGGMINRRVALDHPSRVTALVILNSPHEREPEAQKLYEKAAHDSASGGPEATVGAALARWFTDAFQRDTPDTVASIRAPVVANDPTSYARHRYVLAAGVTELIRPDPPIALPCLVMTCEHDSGSTPAMSHAIASEMQCARVEIAPNLRHLGLVEQPDLFARAITGFLDTALS